jgi:hypothetical protein
MIDLFIDFFSFYYTQLLLNGAEGQRSEDSCSAKDLKKLIIILSFYQIPDDPRIIRLHQTVIEYLLTSFIFY